jgi:poly(3-hydroxybutyrate) depolymerase
VKGEGRSVVCLVALVLALAPSVAAARTEVEFAFGRGKYVKPHEVERAGLVVVPDAVTPGARAPLVVFLHGLNQDGPLHKWMGAKGNPDVSAMLARLQVSGKAAPFLVAAPSQTVDASKPWGMWASFDLSDFIQKTEAALGARAVVDRSRVVVLTHSGGGCNVHGSALLAASATAPRRTPWCSPTRASIAAWPRRSSRPHPPRGCTRSTKQPRGSVTSSRSVRSSWARAIVARASAP